MTDLEHILSELPESQRAEAVRLFRAATDAGWTGIGLWTYDQPPDITDLFGVEPRTGFGAFVRDSTIAESKIPLSPEAQAENDEMWRTLEESLRKEPNQ